MIVQKRFGRIDEKIGVTQNGEALVEYSTLRSWSVVVMKI
jgi:hypothetical protein